MQKPLVSICMISFNHEKHIREAIDGVLMQITNFQVELVIGEDFSTDNTRQICEEYAKTHAEIIQLLPSKMNHGMIPNFFRTMEACRGNYIALCEGDDYWTDPYKLQKQVDFLEGNPDFTICFGKVATLRNDERFDDEHKQYYQQIMQDRTTFTIEDILKDNFIATCAVVFRRKNLSFPDWMNELPFGDWALNVLNAMHGKIKYIDELLAVYRIHDGGVWSSKSIETKLKGRFDFYKLISKHLENKYDEIIIRSITDTAMEYSKHSSSLSDAKIYFEEQYNSSLSQLNEEVEVKQSLERQLYDLKYLLKESQSKTIKITEEKSILGSQLAELQTKLANLVEEQKQKELYTSVLSQTKNSYKRAPKSDERKQRILLTLPFTIIGGADTILLKIFRSLAKNYDITIITTLDAPDEGGDTTPEYKKITQDIYHLKEFFRNNDDMKEFIHYLIDSREVDLIFNVGSQFIYEMLPEIKEKHNGIKFIDQLFNEFGHIENNRKYNDLIDCNILANDKIKEILITDYYEKEEKIKVIIHGVDVNYENNPDTYKVVDKSVNQLTKDKFVISYFGRFSEEKAPDVFVDIVSKLRNYKIQAIMTGNGPMHKSVMDFIRMNNLQDKIFTPGIVNDIKVYMQKSDLVIVPSRIEGLPIVILEALSFGVPVIASDIGGISSVVKNDFNGYLCEKANVDDFVEKIRVLYDDRKKLKLMKKNARGFAALNISEEKMNQSYKETIDKVTDDYTSTTQYNSHSQLILSPLISVVIPCYNQARFLMETVESIVNQTYENWECIIVNDGSTDNTSEIAQEIKDKFSDRKIILINKKNGGVADARNKGIEAAKGEWILPLDSDDKFHSYFLEKAVEAINQNSKLNLVYTNLQQFGDGTDEWIPRDYSAHTILNENHFPIASLFKKELWSIVGGYNIALGKSQQLEDWDLWIRFSVVGLNVYRIPKKYFYYRIHANNTYFQNILPNLKVSKAFVVTANPEVYPYGDVVDYWEEIANCKDDVIEKVNSTIISCPDESLPYFWRALIDEAHHDFENAFINYNKSISLARKDDWQPYYKLGMMQLKQIKGSVHFTDEVSSEELKTIAKNNLLKVKEILSSNSDSPLISVIIPSYNQSLFVSEAIQSVVEQDYQNWECIIVDNGSNDNTSEIVESIINENPDKKIKIIEQNKSCIAKALNYGIRESKGEYILRLDPEDKLDKEYLKSAIVIMLRNNQVGFVYSHLQNFYENSDTCELPEFDRNTLIFKENNVSSSPLIRKKMWKEVGGYNESMNDGDESWDFGIGAVEKNWKGYRINKPLYLHRKQAETILPPSNEKRDRTFASIIMNHKSLYPLNFLDWAQRQLLSSERNQKKHLRITFLINSILGLTGGNQTLLYQANDFAERGHKVFIITYSDKPTWIQLRAEVLKVDKNRKMHEYIPACDIVISTYFLNTHELIDVENVVKIYYAQGDQFIFGNENEYIPSEHSILISKMKELSKLSYLYPDVHFIANSYNLSQSIEKKYGRSAEAVLPVGVNRKVFYPFAKKSKNSQINVLVVGPDVNGSDLEPLDFKGIGDTKKALEILVERGIALNVLRISTSELQIFKDFKCDFYQTPDNKKRTELYGKADILIYASHYDSCPLPPLEAMSSGTAVVCTETTGAREYCIDNYNSILVPTKNPLAIASAVEKLIVDGELRNKLIDNGLKTAEAFEWSKQVDLFEGLLYSLFNKEQQKVLVSNNDQEVRSDVLQKNYEVIIQHLKNKNSEAAVFALQDFINTWDVELFDSLNLGLDSKEVLDIAGNLNLHLGNLDLAKSYFELELNLNPNSSSACLGLGEIFFINEEYDAAKTLFEWAVKNNEQNQAAIKSLIKVNSVLGLEQFHNSLVEV